MAILERWGGFQWYFALALGAVGYGVVRYLAYFMKERRYVRDVLNDAAKRDQVSN
ncbi:MAG: hypothetical protein PSV22_03445 [Pseudolabrys sp.]|nr:hypothetical protein [Pseudolabrys sp.]